MTLIIPRHFTTDFHNKGIAIMYILVADQWRMFLSYIQSFTLELHHSFSVAPSYLAMYSSIIKAYPFSNTVWRKFLTGENIDEFDEFPAICQYFPYQIFPFS